MSEKKLREKLTLLKAKAAAYNCVLDLLKTQIDDCSMSPVYRDVCGSVWRMVLNVRRMVGYGINGVEFDLKRVK